MKVVIALGANLGDPRKQVCMAIDAMRDVMRVDKVSSLYETEPFGVPDEQPPYINAVLIGECELSPADLMKEILAIEAEMGRVRTFTNAARMIDIDVIDYGAQLLDDDFVRLPHPRAHERRGQPTGRGADRSTDAGRARALPTTRPSCGWAG